MKVDLIPTHSIIQMSTKPITEYLNKHEKNIVYTVLICKTVQNLLHHLIF